MQDREWKKEYNIGCDYVDSAHRKLFGILWKVIDLISQQKYEKNKHACMEAIKFLYSYTATHFAEEEAFMKEIGYDGYEEHKKIHDKVKNEVVPMHDKALQESDYSKEAVKEFVGFFIGWLTGHILIEDKAITDDTIKLISTSTKLTVSEKIVKDICLLMDEITDCKLNASKKAYEGRVFKEAVYYEMSFDTTHILFMAENSLIRKMVGDVVGEEIAEVDKAVLVSYLQMMQDVGKAVCRCVNDAEAGKTDKHKLVQTQDVLKHLEENKLTNYVLFETDCGNMEVFVLSAR